MAKELPYFQFEPAEYLTKDISFCSLSAQGLFINICAYYWQRQCNLSLEQFKRRLNHDSELNELINEGVIDIVENQIKIKFLDSQFLKATNQSKVNSSNGSKGGRPKKEKPTETENKPKENPIESETKGIREDKIKEEEIIEDDILLKKETKSIFSFEKSLIEFGAEKQLVKDWLATRKIKKLASTKTALDDFLNEVIKSGKNVNEVLKKCCASGWGGFKASWDWKENNNQQNTSNGKQQTTTAGKERFRNIFSNIANQHQQADAGNTERELFEDTEYIDVTGS